MLNEKFTPSSSARDVDTDLKNMHFANKAVAQELAQNFVNEVNKELMAEFTENQLNAVNIVIRQDGAVEITNLNGVEGLAESMQERVEEIVDTANDNLMTDLKKWVGK